MANLVVANVGTPSMVDEVDNDTTHCGMYRNRQKLASTRMES